MFERDLIFDLGLHEGGDPRFYLDKGFRVVAVEANPQFCDAARQANAGWLVHAILASAFGNSGRVDEARKAGRVTLTLKPDFSVLFVARTMPFKNAAHFEHFANGLRRAGLPE